MYSNDQTIIWNDESIKSNKWDFLWILASYKQTYHQSQTDSLCKLVQSAERKTMAYGLL